MSGTKERTLRQLFGDFKRSTACFEMKSFLLRQQKGLCPITKELIYLTEDTHLSHIISVKQLTQLRTVDPQLAERLVTDHRNLFLEKATSNKKRSSKPCVELLDDLLEQLQLNKQQLEALQL